MGRASPEDPRIVSAETESFLGAFFGAGNDLSVENLVASNPVLAEWLERRIAALRASPLSPTLLPRRRGDTLTWYGLARSVRERRELVQVLQSFVGPTYATLRVDRPLNPEDLIDVAVRAYAEQSFTINVRSGEQAEVRRALDLFFELDAIRPRRRMSVSRPLGRLLREFEMAVLAGAGELSSELLAEIEASGQLSAQNIVFLRIRRLSGLRLISEVLALPELATVLAIRRPARVTAALFDALYSTELARFEVESDAPAALNHFAEIVLPRYPALFRSRQGLRTAAAIKAYALYTATAHPEDRSLLAELAASTDLDAEERSYLQRVANLVAAVEEPTVSLATAADAAREGRFDAALALARDLPPTIDRAELLVRCAVEIDSLEGIRGIESTGSSADQRSRRQRTGENGSRGPVPRHRSISGLNSPSGPLSSGPVTPLPPLMVGRSRSS
jgi:uncharacterized protein YqcC (DUF446 family)